MDSVTWKTDLPILNALFLGSKPNGFHLTEEKLNPSLEGNYKTLLSDFMSLYLPPALSAPAQRPFHSLLPPPSSAHGSLSPSLCSDVFYALALSGALH